MLPTNRLPTHPGAMLRDEFLTPLGLSQSELARQLGIPIQRVNELIAGKRGMTPETAWLLAAFFKTSPQVWMSLQVNYDLARTRPANMRALPSKAKRAPAAKRAKVG